MQPMSGDRYQYVARVESGKWEIYLGGLTLQILSKHKSWLTSATMCLSFLSLDGIRELFRYQPCILWLILSLGNKGSREKKCNLN